MHAPFISAKTYYINGNSLFFLLQNNEEREIIIKHM